MSPSRSNRKPGGHKEDGKKHRDAQPSVRRLIKSLENHTVNTMTEIVRIERIAATCDDENDAIAFQRPMTEAWNYYVHSNQFLTELRGLTRNYPFSASVLDDAKMRVRNDPGSNRSWNTAWLCLRQIVENNLISTYAAVEATKRDMWGGHDPDAAEASQLAQCFEYEWNVAVNTMLQHWPQSPTWY
ncbi:unnamed protein product [Discula destructiva]